MTIERPAILWGIPGSAIMRDGSDTGVIRITEHAVPHNLVFPAAPGVIDLAKIYYLSGDGDDDDLVKVLGDAFIDWDANFSIAIDADNFVTLHKAGGGFSDFEVNGDDVATTVDLEHWGFVNDDTIPIGGSAATVVGPDRAKGWFPVDVPEEPEDDALPVVAGGSETISGKSRVIKLGRTKGRVANFKWESLDAALVRRNRALATGPHNTLERAWDESISEGYPFRYYPDASIRTTTSYRTYRVRDDQLRSNEFPWSISAESALFWDVLLKAIRTDD